MAERPDHNLREQALEHFEYLRSLHAGWAEERQHRALSVFLAGAALIVTALAAAEYTNERGGQPNLHLHWGIPFLVVALFALDTRFRVFSARAEELMSNVYSKQIEWLVGRPAELNQTLQDFRDDEIQYYSEREDWKIWWTTRVIQSIGYLPLFLVSLWSGISVFRGRGVTPISWNTE